MNASLAALLDATGAARNEGPVATDEASLAAYDRLVGAVETERPAPLPDDDLAALDEATLRLARTRHTAGARLALRLFPLAHEVPRAQASWALRAQVLGAMLGRHQGDEALEEALDRHGGDATFAELLACWVQEAVLLRGAAGARRAVERFWRGLPADHPLAWLPLERLAFEGEITGDDLAELDFNGGRGAMVSVQDSHRQSFDPPARGAPRPRAVDATDGAAREALEAAVRGWIDDSNCDVEAREFLLSGPIEPADFDAAILHRLGLRCLQGAPPSSVRTRRRTVVEVYRVLIAAASNGGAYGPFAVGAYARAGALRTLGALAGARPLRGPDIEAAAARATFLTFDAPSPFWLRVATSWDLAFAALRPDGATVAVLAASDTD